MLQTTHPEAVARMGGRPIGRVVFTAAQIQARVREMGAEIEAAFPVDDELLVLGLLKGSFIFLADLVRQIRRPLQVDFLSAASYGKNAASAGEVRLVYDPEAVVEGKHVVLVEDIVDSGHTLNRLLPLLRSRGPRSLEVCALLHKRLASGLVTEPRWIGFAAPPEFLVGYGLDFSEDFRHLPFIASLGELK